jgi:hypothetical protein
MLVIDHYSEDRIYTVKRTMSESPLELMGHMPFISHGMKIGPSVSAIGYNPSKRYFLSEFLTGSRILSCIIKSFY